MQDALDKICADNPDLFALGFAAKGAPIKVEHFMLAIIFLARFAKSATINPYRTSYGLKHHMPTLNYVTNGAFIAAAIHSGFRIERDGHDARINIAEPERLA